MHPFPVDLRAPKQELMTGAETPQERTWLPGRRRGTLTVKLVVAAVVVAGIAGVVQPAIAPPVAQAVVVQGPDKVGWGRAALLFNRDETLKIGTGGLVNVPPAGPIGAAFALAKAGLAVIALNYYNRGLCSAYTWSVRPWDNQGFMSRKC